MDLLDSDRSIRRFGGARLTPGRIAGLYVLVASAQAELRVKDRAMDEAPVGITIAERRVSVDVLNYRADGTPFWNRLDVVPVADDAGETTHFLGIQQDVTERKERKQRLAVLNRVLRHNRRNKLNVVRGHAEAIETDSTRSEESVAAIHGATDELLAAADQIREFDALVAADERHLELVSRDSETPLDHVLGLELWLVRWATELSHGEFEVDFDADPAVISLRFARTLADDAPPVAGTPPGGE